MRRHIFLLSTALLFFLYSCGNSESKNQSEEVIIEQEKEIANEVEKASEKAKEEASKTEEEVDELLKDI